MLDRIGKLCRELTKRFLSFSRMFDQRLMENQFPAYTDSCVDYLMYDF